MCGGIDDDLRKVDGHGHERPRHQGVRNESVVGRLVPSDVCEAIWQLAGVGTWRKLGAQAHIRFRYSSMQLGLPSKSTLLISSKDFQDI